MAPGPSLQLPSFLHGIFPGVHQKVKKEGQRCGKQYREHGTFPPPRQMRDVSPSDVVLMHEVTDFQRDQPAWRLYMVSKLMGSLTEIRPDEWQNPFPVRDAYEECFRQTAWGALYFAVDPGAPRSTQRTALRLQAVLHFWEPLQSARYLFKKLGAVLTLEELMVAACGWTMEAWSPVGEDSVRARLATAAERMAQATREDSIEAILRHLPRVLTSARNLKHRDVVANPSFQRERITALDAEDFERVSAACTSDVLGLVYSWDRRLAAQ